LRKRWKLLGLMVVVLGATTFAATQYFPSRPLYGHRGPLPAITAEERALSSSLRSHVEAIASKPRNTGHPEALEASAQYIEAQLAKLSLTIERQTYSADGQTVRNIHTTIGRLVPGVPTFIVGAHYDSAYDAPGANDNGSGVAALLELARLLKDHQPRRHRLRLVFFVNEEPPHFLESTMGSAHFARWIAGREKVRGMISLETIGSFSDQPGTQKFPPPFSLVYENKGDFVAFVGTTQGRPLVNEALAVFRRHTSFPSIGGVGYRFIPGIDWSDHASFDDLAIPALMITDTAIFRYPHYHKRTDTPDKLDYERLSRVTKGVERMLREIVD